MRHTPLLLLLAIASTVLWFALKGVNLGGAEGPESSSGDPLAPAAGAVHEASEDVPSPDSPLPPATERPPEVVGSSGALEGQVVNRFGHAAANQRVYLLREDQVHPPAGAELTRYVTGFTSRDGSFSFDSPGEGPWRLAIGPPGKPVIPPSEPRRLSGGERAEVTVPGGAAVRVTLDSIPKDGAYISLEFLALVEPVRRPNPVEGAGGSRGKREGGRGGETRAETDGFFSTEDASYQGDGSSAAGEGRDETGRRRAPGGRQRQRKDDPPAPPKETWQALHRHLVTEEERAVDVAEISDLPGGRTVRLVVRIGKERIEGTVRFTLMKDAVIEVRILSIKTGPGASLAYSAVPRILQRSEMPVGIRWVD
jgi:hypothetical protein